MCCRYLLEESPELRPIIEAMNRSPLAVEVFPLSSMRTEGEVRPADTAPVLARSRKGHNVVVPMKWGFSGKSLVINARSETAAVRPINTACRQSPPSPGCAGCSGWRKASPALSF